MLEKIIALVLSGLLIGCTFRIGCSLREAVFNFSEKAASVSTLLDGFYLSEPSSEIADPFYFLDFDP